jgi:8-oxo-dGTP diphosphatase
VESLVRRLTGIVPSYLGLAWWGLVSPHLRESTPLLVHQAVVLGEQGVLLAMRRDLRGWELPGGGAAAGESGEIAVVREVFEETSMCVRVERLVGDYVRTGFRPHTARVYCCSAESGVPRGSGETSAVDWFDPQAPPTTLFPWYRRPLADALEAGPPRRRHEYLGIAAVLAGMAIDLRTRLYGAHGAPTL